jgi:hypothetical protein
MNTIFCHITVTTQINYDIPIARLRDHKASWERRIKPSIIPMLATSAELREVTVINQTYIALTVAVYDDHITLM